MVAFVPNVAQLNNMGKLDKEYIKSFIALWLKLYAEYKKEFPNNRISFPEPLQKKILIDYFDSSLVLDTNSSYDFCGNVEVKSSTKSGGGCTPFQKTQNDCKRILYLEISAGCIDVYDLSPNDVSTINTIIINAKKSKNISLAKYKSKATHTPLIF